MQRAYRQVLEFNNERVRERDEAKVANANLARQLDGALAVQRDLQNKKDAALDLVSVLRDKLSDAETKRNFWMKAHDDMRDKRVDRDEERQHLADMFKTKIHEGLYDSARRFINDLESRFEACRAELRDIRVINDKERGIWYGCYDILKVGTSGRTYELAELIPLCNHHREMTVQRDVLMENQTELLRDLVDSGFHRSCCPVRVLASRPYAPDCTCPWRLDKPATVGGEM
jgi:hypothetical protein